MEPEWQPSTTHELAYTNNQVRIGDSFEEFRFDMVVGERPDKLLSDDAQAAMDTGAFRHMYEARDEVTDMARESVRLAEMNRPPHLGLEPDVASNLTAVEAHSYLAGLQAAAVQANDVDEANRLQDLINGLEHYAFDRYTTALADAEAFHAQTPAKLGSNFDANALANRLTALAEEQMALADSRHLSDEERHHAGKLSVMYMLAAQDTMQGLDPLVHIQEMMNSGLDKADAAIYSDLASGVSGAMFPGSASATRPGAARSLWARAGEIANGLMTALRRLDSRPGNGISHVDTVPETPGPVRFLGTPPGPRVPDPEPLTGGPARVRGVGSVPAAGDARRSASGTGTGSGSGSRHAPRSSGPPGLPPGEAAHLNPARDGGGAHWKDPRHHSRGRRAGPLGGPAVTLRRERGARPDFRSGRRPVDPLPAIAVADGTGDYLHSVDFCLESANSIACMRPSMETRVAKPIPYRRIIMKPRRSTAVAAPREGFLSFPVPPPAGRGHDLYRRYAFAALGPDRAERLLCELNGNRPAPESASRA